MSAPLQRFVDDELALQPALVQRVVAGSLQLLGQGTDSGDAPGERTRHAEIAAALRRDAATFERTFVASLARRVHGEVDDAAPPAPDPGATTPPDARLGVAGFELMDESRVEADIELSRAAQLIDATAEWELRELQTYTSTLVGQTHVASESNPFRPLVYAAALRDATAAVVGSATERAALLRTAAGVAAGLLKNAWAAATTRLEAQGVQPGIYRTVVLPSGATVGRPQAAHGARLPPGLHALLGAMPSAAVVAAARVVAREAGAGDEPAERQAAELVERLFASMRADGELTPAAAAIVDRLEAAACRIAASDRTLFDGYDHPVWRLLDRIGTLSIAQSRADDVRLVAFLALAGGVADEIAGAAAADAALFRRALNRIDAQLAERLHSEVWAAQASIEALKLAERREVLEQHLMQRLTEQMVPVRTTPAIRRFVTGTWARVIATEMLEHGDQSEAALVAFKTVDDLLWSVRIPDHPQSRQRLVQLLPGLLQRVRAGMDRVGVAAADQRAVLDELMVVHTEALRPGGGGSGALTPEQIVQRMREEVLADTPVRRSFSDSVIDLSSMETVPADMLSTGGASGDDDAGRRVESMRAGERYRIFVDGRWSRVQLLWRSDRGLFWLFAGDAPERRHSITRRALERLAAAGLVQPLEARPLVQRSAERLARETART